jgi:arginine decarboxylase
MSIPTHDRQILSAAQPVHHTDSDADFPILIVQAHSDQTTTSSLAARAVAEIFSALAERGFEFVSADGTEDGGLAVRNHPELACVLIGPDHEHLDSAVSLIELIRSRNDHLPVFLLADGLAVADIPLGALDAIQGSIWSSEDTPEFVAGRVAHAIDAYRGTLYPPFFGRLARYVDEDKYAWHTPGHMGGVAFRNSPAGRRFFDFFGENVFRADLCSSVPELGSVLEHEGVVAEAENEAARVFGAEHTWFVTNGTTMSNEIVFRGTVRAGDIVVLDRNCHKSILNSVIQTGAIPLWLLPVRNAQGMIGPINPAELSAEAIQAKLRANPLVTNPDSARLRLAVVTNSTYDGTMYNADFVLERLRETVPIMHFDEAWIPYAAFHPLFEHHYGMAPRPSRPDDPTVFSTMSIHKLLASFSQGSMIHVREGRHPFDPHRFNEAFMLHTSTSPQYTMVASLDVATRMMEGAAGRALMSDTVEEAIAFRQELTHLADQLAGKNEWCFRCWQPTTLDIATEDPSETLARTRFEDAPASSLANLRTCWEMRPGEAWHGFDGLEDGYTMLDPTKVSLITPGVGEDGTPAEFGVPAGLVARFLRDHGIVVEKTGFYSILALFTIGTTHGKSSTLLTELLEFKRMLDRDAPIAEAIPSLITEHPGRYDDVGLAGLAKQMHAFLAAEDTAAMQEAIYRAVPTPAITPSEAFGKLVDGDVELVPLEQLDGRTTAVLCVLYPPGIPVIVPGERFEQAVLPIAHYLQIFATWADTFPGFENEMQGVSRGQAADGSSYHGVYCVTESVS